MGYIWFFLKVFHMEWFYILYQAQKLSVVSIVYSTGQSICLCVNMGVVIVCMQRYDCVGDCVGD